jgi:hypothetical protein
MKMFNEIKAKMVRPVGFEPTSTIKILNKINTKKLVRSPLETLNGRLLMEISEKSKENFNAGCRSRVGNNVMKKSKQVKHFINGGPYSICGCNYKEDLALIGVMCMRCGEKHRGPFIVRRGKQDATVKEGE